MYIRIVTLSLIISLAYYFANAQESVKDEKISIHQIELKSSKEKIISNSNKSSPAQLDPSFIKFGYHPYWAADDYQKYDYSILTHLGFFSYSVDTSTAGYKNKYGWGSGSPVISYAHERNVNVILVVTNFGGAENKAILSDSIKSITLANNLVTELQEGNGDGINIDFEGIPSSEKSNFVRFISMLRARMKETNSKWELSLASPAVDWSGAWDFYALSKQIDYFIMMGYDYYYSGSPNAGPVAPFNGGNYNVVKSINSYFMNNVRADMLVLGVPWYGYDWLTVDNKIQSKTIGTGTARTYDAMEMLADKHIKDFDFTYRSAYIKYQDSAGKWREAWYDDSLSLAYKYRYVKDTYMRGVAIWAISYNLSDHKLWQGLADVLGYGTDVEEAVEEPGLIYPNPAEDYIIINNNSGKKEGYSLYNSGGEKIMEYYSEGDMLIINIKNLNEGMYTIVDKEFKKCGRFIKSK